MMNIKRNIFAVLAAAVLLASCSQDEVMTDTGPDGLVPVTLSAAVGDGVQTRAIDADNAENPTRCYVQAFTTDDNGKTLTLAPGDLASPLDMGDPTAEGTFSLVNVYLNPNETYVFLYWADNAEKTEDSEGLTDLRNVDYHINRIAWAKRSEIWKYQESEPTEITAELQHVVAKVTLKTTTNVEADSKITVTVPTTYTRYNVADETVIQDVINKNVPFEHTVTNAITGTKDGTEVFSFYALVDEANQDLTLTNGTNSQPVSNVPLGPNKHTTLVGDVQNIGLTNVTFTASVVGDWGSTETEIIGLEIADDGTYIVSSPAALQAWATAVQSNPSLNCTLAADITLPTPAEGESNWIPVGMGDTNMFRGIFDGAGHTISNLVLNTPQQTRCLYTGFISALSGAVVKNLHIRNASVTGTSNVVGGIIGCLLNNSSVIGCSFTGEVIGNTAYSRVGGIAGAMDAQNSIVACYSSGTISANNGSVGGIVGEMQESSLTGCYSTAQVTDPDSDCGDIVGYILYQATITACCHSVTDKSIGYIQDNASTINIII